MIPLTTLATGSMIALIFTLIMAFYGLYLNWKQSKVNNQMKELIEYVKYIQELLLEFKRRN